MGDSDSLRGVYAKLDRARVHLADLENETKAVLSSPEFSIVRSLNSDETGYRYTLRSDGIIPSSVSLILGNFLTNLRAALDHLAWQLVLLEGGIPGRSTSFPILDSRVTKNGAQRPARIDGVQNPDLFSLIEFVQPYQLPAPENHPLFMLNELVNEDKHHLLLVAAFAVKTTGIWWTSDDELSGFQINQASVNDGETIASFDFVSKPPPSEFDPHLELEIRLLAGPETRALRRVHLIGIAELIYMTVEHKVVSEFAKFFGVGPRNHIGSHSPQPNRP